MPQGVCEQFAISHEGRLVAGMVATGTTVYELPPGQAICPYHYEYGEEEWLLVLSGTPTLRTPDGDLWLNGAEGVSRIPAAEIAAFVANPDHRVTAETFGVQAGIEGAPENLRPVRDGNMSRISPPRAMATRVTSVVTTAMNRFCRPPIQRHFIP